MGGYEHDSGADQHFRSMRNRAAIAIARDVAEDARRLAPEDSGRLKRSIEPVDLGDGRAAVVARIFYAVFVERGTKKTRGQAFLRPALYRQRTVKPE